MDGSESAAAGAPQRQATKLEVEHLNPLTLHHLPACMQSTSNRKLQMLRETVDVLRPEMDAAVWNRSTMALKELVQQLGPIGAAVDAK